MRGCAPAVRGARTLAKALNCPQAMPRPPPTRPVGGAAWRHRHRRAPPPSRPTLNKDTRLSIQQQAAQIRARLQQRQAAAAAAVARLLCALSTATPPTTRAASRDWRRNRAATAATNAIHSACRPRCWNASAPTTTRTETHHDRDAPGPTPAARSDLPAAGRCSAGAATAAHRTDAWPQHTGSAGCAAAAVRVIARRDLALGLHQCRRRRLLQWTSPTATPQPHPIGDTAQPVPPAGVRTAGWQHLPILGDQATLSYARYMKQLRTRDPGLFETDVAKSKGSSSSGR